MSDTATLTVPDADQAMAMLGPIPAAPASLLALASRIAALEQTLSYEAASSPPILVALPPLTAAAQPNAATPTSAASTASTTATAATAASSSSTLSTSSRRLTASSSLSPLPPVAAALPSLSFVAKVHELQSALQAMEDDATAHFFAVHAQYEQLLASSASLSSFLNSAAAKQQILLSQYGELTALHSQLTRLTQLLPHITPPATTVTAADVDRLEKAMRERAVEVARLHVAIDRFVSVWDSCVEAINGMLLAMDARMSRWEQQVDSVAKQKQLQTVS